jgi:phosphate-selective porin
MSFTLKGVDMDFQLDYQLYSRPEWLKDKGTGRVTIRGLTITMKMTPYTKDGKLQVNFTKEEGASNGSDLEMADYQVELQG